MQTADEHETMMSSQAAHRALTGIFGFDTYRNGQEQVINRLLAGSNVLSVFPTGGGKSLCYQLPALLLDGLTLVISPLIALMKDQVDFLATRGVPAGRLDSSLAREETLHLYEELNDGRLKLLYISPERLGNERFLHSMQRRRIALLAIDEAHCISEWGHNFRPDYLKISRLAEQLKVERVLALTATATPEVAGDIARAFNIAKEDIVNTGFYRPNLKLAATPCTAAERQELLLARMRKRPQGPTIVYVTLQRTAEEVAGFLCENGFDARPYHAGMDTDDRNATQDAFLASDKMAVVATIAFGMGIDKPDIRHVYHYNLPKGLESYMQEIGRGGRDGKDSVCELLACADDIVTLENFTYGDTPTPEAVAALISDVLDRGDEFDISVYELSGRHDVRPLVVQTLLAYLELQNVIVSTGHFYSEFKFQPQRSSREILARFDAQRAAFLRAIFGHAREGKTWFTINVEGVCRSTGEKRDRIVKALGYLEETGDITLQASGVRQGYRIIEAGCDRSALGETLSARFARREEQDIARIQRIVRWAEHGRCLTQHLLDYFGEERGECGHCLRCQGIRASSLPPARYDPPGEADVARIRSLLAEGHDALAAPRQLARFLCGIPSPATTRAKLRTHHLFGAYQSVPFREILDILDREAAAT